MKRKAKNNKPKAPKRSHTRRDLLACPHCGHRQSEVTKTDPVSPVIVRRDRVCLACRKLFQTGEGTDLLHRYLETMQSVDTGIETLLAAIRSTAPSASTALPFLTGSDQ
jgi:DNA-directed RNA polymerase subunit RPC12/RpoP